MDNTNKELLFFFIQKSTYEFFFLIEGTVALYLVINTNEVCMFLVAMSEHSCVGSMKSLIGCMYIFICT